MNVIGLQTTLPQIIAAIGGLGTAAFGLVEASKAAGGGVNRIGFPRIRATVTALTPSAAAQNALSQAKIIDTLQANWFNGTDLASQKAIAKTLIHLNLAPGNAAALASATGVDPATLTAIANNIVTGTALTPAQSDVFGRFDLIITALLDETYQRSDQAYRTWTKFWAMVVSILLALAGAFILNGPNLHAGEVGEALLVGVLATPLAPIAKDLSTALTTAVNALQVVNKGKPGMTPFLDVRIAPVGGNLATKVALNQSADGTGYQGLLLTDLLAAITGRHVLIATHGFNVDRASGVKNLWNWGSLLQLDSSSVFIGLLWPGDSTWAHGLNYPEEPRAANDAAKIIAPFIDANFTQAASVSFASHSLGARVVLETISLLHRRVRRAILMAGAIDDNCLDAEFQRAALNVDAISVLASKKDEVLSLAFPLGNLFAGIIAAGHPWWRGALGRGGPSSPIPGIFVSPFEIPDAWNFGHGNYITAEPAPLPAIARPQNIPPENSKQGPPATPPQNWHAAWTAAVAAADFNKTAAMATNCFK